ncbi:hypothetical protein [Streptomyces niveus]|uniref:hypothetical protein n=1 Tax=Streptomyces niveus TaxID=193462 RepID=UPI00368682D8
MTTWIDCGVLAWIDEKQHREDETVLVYFKGVSLASMAEGLSARNRPPFAYSNATVGDDWGVIVHHMFNHDDYDGIDYRGLCPEGAELMVFVPNPCVAKAHGPKAYHYQDGQALSCIDYEAPDYVGEYWPNTMAPLITAAGLDHENEIYEEQLTQLICDHLGLPALDRDTITVDRDLVASCY